MFSFRMIGYWVLVGGLLAPPCAGQALQWEARFDDVAGGEDYVRGAATGPDGTVHILGEYELGQMLVSFDDDGKLVREVLFQPLVGAVDGTLVCDASGSLFVAAVGRTADEQNYTLRVYKLAPGEDEWSHFEYAVTDFAFIRALGLKLTPDGELLLLGAGRVTQVIWEAILVKFSPDGAFRWAARHQVAPQPDDERNDPVTVAFDIGSDGNAYVAASAQGQSGPNDLDVLTVSFDAAGQQRWERLFSINPEAPNDACYVRTITVAGDGVFVTSFGGRAAGNRFGISAHKYSLGGEFQWSFFRPSLSGTVTHGRVDPLSGDFWMLGRATQSPQGFGTGLVVIRLTAGGQAVFETVVPAPGQTQVPVGLVFSSEGGALVSILFGSGNTFRHQMLHVLPDGIIARDERTPDETAPDPSHYSTAALLPGLSGQVKVVRANLDPSTDYDVTVSRYDSTGAWLDTAPFSTTVPSYDHDIEAIVATLDGDTYVLGNSTQGPGDGSLVLIRYDLNGSELWRTRILDPGAHVGILQLDLLGRPLVITTIDPSTQTDDADILMIGYNADGSQRWRRIHDGPTGQDDIPRDAAVSSFGMITVTAHTRIGNELIPTLLRFNEAGTLLWDRIGLIAVDELAVDPAGNVFILGPGRSVARYASSNGVTQWFRWVERQGCDAASTILAVDSDGNATVAGQGCLPGSPSGPLIHRWTSDGQLAWTHSMADIAPNSGVVAIRPGSQGRLFLVVSTWYSSLVIARLTPAGERLWTTRYDQSDSNLRVLDLYHDDYSSIVTAETYTGSPSVMRLLVLRLGPDGQPTWRALYDHDEQMDFDPDASALHPSGLVAGGIHADASGNRDFVTVSFGPEFNTCDWNGPCDIPDPSADCVVDLDDLAAVLVNFGSSPWVGISPADGDVDFDGSISLADLAAVLAAFGSQCP